MDLEKIRRRREREKISLCIESNLYLFQ